MSPQHALHVAAYYYHIDEDDLFEYWYYVSGNYLRFIQEQDDGKRRGRNGPSP